MGRHNAVEAPGTFTYMTYICGQIPTNKHHKPTVIRWWPAQGCTIANSAVVNGWEDGLLTLPVTHPLAKMALADSMAAEITLTVESTPEWEWVLDSWSIRRGFNMDMAFVPRQDWMRQGIVPDSTLISMWLAAEERWHQDRLDGYLYSQEAHCG